MNRLLLIAGILMMTGMTTAQARSCRPSEVQRGCYTEHCDPRPGSPHGTPYCDCSGAQADIDDVSDSSIAQPEVFDVILNLDGQRQKVRCCGGRLLPRECPCDQ